ncbi:hypothetical protein FAM09_15580 [Niastella caeni]|uniref:Uncharacterized protein n=1 Tax=Niastella caeni TaxID=2569763 RepID=A0A4S8HS34_9BACT|nr:hypothetical protein [Niastella caeni]THU38105.1 hypothetical protein FAM09_15580 [Niastella caeni]
MRQNRVLKDQWLNEVVPDQRSGQSSFTHSHIKCRNINHAKECYKVAANRLRNVNRWHEYAGKASASFKLFNETGIAVNRHVQKSDYLRINIPGPDNPDGDGSDWVQVIQVGEKLTDQQQLTFITVKTASNPLVRTLAPSHFFDQPATSTFVIYRKQLIILAAVFGRNEHSNLRSRNLFTKIRNWFVYIGAQLGLANLQWKALTHGLLHVNQS